MDPTTLRDRLRGIVKVPSTAPGLTAAAKPEDIALGRNALDVLGGSWRETATGRSFVVTHRFPPDQAYGRYRVGDLGRELRDAHPAAAMLGPAAANLPFVFFDLETTGLSGGAGTFAFLVGCGWFDDQDAFVTEQHLMVDYNSERAMLHVVASVLQSAGALMTFNGKSFDAPLLETRYLFHRLESPCDGLPHVDLLHPARRFWQTNAVGDCSLGTLEDRILGRSRIGDISGFEIPARYFQFVRTGHAGPLIEVLEHNRLDLMSLAGLAARLLHLIDAGPEAACHAREAFALGRTYKAAGFTDRAETAFERALTMAEARESRNISRRFMTADVATIQVEALRALAVTARRQRRYEAAAERWCALLELEGCPDRVRREATEALAIHHEHRARDLGQAKAYALKALEWAGDPALPQRGAARRSGDGRWGDAVRHRLARIERKLVSEGRPLFAFLTSPPSDGSRTSVPRTSS